MKPNIHPELYRAMQSAREEDISRKAGRRRADERPDRTSFDARCGRAVAFFERTIRDAPVNLLRGVEAPTNIHANVPPLADNAPLPK